MKYDVIFPFNDNIWYETQIVKGKICHTIGLNIGPFSAYSKTIGVD